MWFLPKAPEYAISLLEKALYTAGWVLLISNDITDALQAMCIYRDKDVVEKVSCALKTVLI